MSCQALRGFTALILLAVVAALASTSSALCKSKQTAAPTSEQSDKAAENSGAAGKPAQLGIYGDWGAYLAKGENSKTCYALATPKDRAPSSLTRDPAYIFISNRPGENVRQEISVIVGFPLKEDGAHAEVSGAHFALLAKGDKAWIKNTAEEAHLIEALKKASKLVVKAASTKGHVTTDTYSLVGLSQALERIDKECP
jgi:hypothetical protein